MGAEIQLSEDLKRLFKDTANEEDIKRRILKVRDESLSVNPYKCIRELRFLDSRMRQHPKYFMLAPSFTDKSRVLDLGCCFGLDTRHMIGDGVNGAKSYSIEKVPEFIRFGFDLFQDEEILRSCFYTLDVNSDKFVTDLSNYVIQRENLEINEDEGFFDIVHCGALLHLLEQEQVKHVIQNVDRLLHSTGVFFGYTVAGETPLQMPPNPNGLKFLHSIDSLTQLFGECGFDNVWADWVKGKEPVGEKQVTAQWRPCSWRGAKYDSPLSIPSPAPRSAQLDPRWEDGELFVISQVINKKVVYFTKIQ